MRRDELASRIGTLTPVSLKLLSMSSGFAKFLLLLGALLIAGSITYYPWAYMDELTDATDAFYFLTAIYWAPAFLLTGLLTGFVLRSSCGRASPKSSQSKRPLGHRQLRLNVFMATREISG